MNNALTAERLRELLHYDPLTGTFRWRFDRGPIKGKSIAGTITCYGYISISVDGKKYPAHRLAWLYSNGAFPSSIDHKNGVRSDNRIENLREASAKQNMQNMRSAHKTNKSGFLGVHAHAHGAWRAQIRIDGKKIYIGTYSTPELAHAAYLAAKKSSHPFGLVADDAGPSPERRSKQRRGASGIEGVSRSGNRWAAYARRRDGTQAWIGRFTTKEEARSARIAWDLAHL